jgi:hypothetical protein
MPMFNRHQLACQRPGCGRTFTATRSDAQFCSRSCRRHHDTPSPAPTEAADSAPLEDLHGWRRVGPYLVPPFNPANVFRADDWFR